MDKEFNQEAFLTLFRQETEKVLQAISKLHQKVLLIEARVVQAEREINELNRRTTNGIILH